MLEGAIVSTKCALRDEFPEFMEFFDEKGWETKPEEVAESGESDEGATAEETLPEEITSDTEESATETAENENDNA